MGEIANMLYAVVLIGFVSLVFLGAISTLAANYSVPLNTTSIANLNNTMNSNMNLTSGWVVNSTNQTGVFNANTDNSLIWMTQGAFNVLISVFQLPQMFIDLAMVLINSINIGLGDSGIMVYFLGMIAVLITMPFLFAVLKAILKVEF